MCSVSIWIVEHLQLLTTLVGLQVWINAQGSRLASSVQVVDVVQHRAPWCNLTLFRLRPQIDRHRYTVQTGSEVDYGVRRMSNSDEPDSPPALSTSTAAILQQFLVQQAKAEEDAADDPFQENWGLSQFWYTDETAAAVAAEAVKLAAGGSIACIACPSLFRCLRKRYPDQPAHLLEYDSRFEVSQQPSCRKEWSLDLQGAWELAAWRGGAADPSHVDRRGNSDMRRCWGTSLCTTTTSRSPCQRRCTKPSKSLWRTHHTWCVHQVPSQRRRNSCNHSCWQPGTLSVSAMPFMLVQFCRRKSVLRKQRRRCGCCHGGQSTTPASCC